MYQDAGSGMPAPPKKKGGCLKWGGIGCAVIIILIIILAIGLWTQKDKLIGWAADKMKQAILQSLPEDFDAAEAANVIEEFWLAVEEDRIDEAAAQQLGTKFQTAFADGELTSEESEELLQFMKDAAGIESEDPYAGEEQQYEEEGWEDDEPAGTAEEPAGDVTEL